MKEYREAIADDRKRLEAFYNQIGSSILDKAEKSLQETNKQAISALKNRIQELDKATNRLNWQFIAIYSSAFVALVMVFFLAIFLYVPSQDEIQQRRADVAWLEQKYSLDIKNCNGRACVRIMKNDCHGTNKDYCAIDPR